MIARPIFAAMIASMTMLPGCATLQDKPSTRNQGRMLEAVGVSVGPCFGFCPVYDIELRADGALRFVGVRHTAVLGGRTREVGVPAYRKLVGELAAYRPPVGSEAVVPCDAEVSDTSTYVVTWTSADGRKTVATLAGGCPEGAARALGTVLQNLPVRLGVAAWAKQTTRPGSSRG